MNQKIMWTLGPVFLVVCIGASATAQQQETDTTAPQDLPTLGSILTAETLADLPLGENVYSPLETTQAEVIADRFNAGGLNIGQAARVGGFLGSSSQTLFRIGDVSITDPGGSGAPLFFPELFLWGQVAILNGLMPPDANAPGIATILVPREPAKEWTTTLRASGSGGALARPSTIGLIPPIARLQDWAYGSAVVGGSSASGRAGIFAGGAWTRGSKFERELGPPASSSLGSGFAHLVYTPARAGAGVTESRTFAWVQRARAPFEYRALFQPGALTTDESIHLQSTWAQVTPNAPSWRVFGGITSRSRTNRPGSPSATADRLFDGPIPAIVEATGDSRTTRWTVGARVFPKSESGLTRHLTEIGGNVDHAFIRESDQFTGPIGEFVDGVPARLWAFTHPDADSRRHSTTVAMFARDHVSFSPGAHPVTLDVALRFESITGRADGATNGVNWQAWLPSAMLRWNLTTKTWLVGGYRRAANQLTLNLLSYGDPAGPTATVTRLVASPLALPPQVATIIDRVGPGTGGNPSFSRIDGNLKQPTTDEFVVGVESQRRSWLRLGLTGVARREHHLIGVVDTGVPLSGYTTMGIPDPGHDFFSADDDQVLTVYNRLPSSFGANQYVLTNPGQQAAAAYGLKLTAQGSTDRLFLLFGATASAGMGSAGNRGYLAIENDQDAVGELYTNPNASTFARGRLFSDRAFTIKWTTVYRFPHDFRVGAIARYQDGQPFARLVVASTLNQGAELIRAYGNGGNRFTFTGTLDIRVQKGLRIGKSRVDAILDFYNLATRSNEVEEYVVTGSNFRTPTAIEPPRSIHLGARLTF